MQPLAKQWSNPTCTMQGSVELQLAEHLQTGAQLEADVLHQLQRALPREAFQLIPKPSIPSDVVLHAGPAASDAPAATAAAVSATLPTGASAQAPPGQQGGGASGRVAVPAASPDSRAAAALMQLQAAVQDVQVCHSCQSALHVAATSAAHDAVAGMCWRDRLRTARCGIAHV